MSSAARSATLVVTVLSLLTVTACGAEPRTTTRTEQVLTTPAPHQPTGSAAVTDPARARYVALVDAVCSRYNPRREQAVHDAGQAKDTEHAVQAYDDGLTLAEQQLRGIEAIASPTADRALIQANVVDRLRERIVLRRALSGDLAESDAESAQRHRADLDALTIALQAFARGYGFKVCGAR